MSTEVGGRDDIVTEEVTEEETGQNTDAVGWVPVKQISEWQLAYTTGGRVNQEVHKLGKIISWPRNKKITNFQQIPKYIYIVL